MEENVRGKDTVHHFHTFNTTVIIRFNTAAPHIISERQCVIPEESLIVLNEFLSHSYEESKDLSFFNLSSLIGQLRHNNNSTGLHVCTFHINRNVFPALPFMPIYKKTTEQIELELKVSLPFI